MAPWRTLGGCAAVITALSSLAQACAAGSDETNPAGTGAATGTGTPSSGNGAGGAAGTGSSGEGGALFDGGLGGAAPASCQYVDLLFVIDNSPSMGPHQEELALAFPSFVDAMFDKLPENVDLHVGITTTSFFDGSCSESVSNCVSQASAADIAAHYIKPTDGTTSDNGEQGRLFEHAGKKFFAANTSEDPGPLKAWFSGAAVAAGETGCSFEMMSAAGGYAFHPANAAHNDGFVRDENGVLLVMVLSDEPDKSPEGTAAYHDMVVAAKSGCGGDKCVLTAGIIDPCIEGVNNPLWEFLHAFGEPPPLGDIDDPASYTAVVGDALAQVVKQVCDEIAVPR